MCLCAVLSHCSHVRHFVTPWTAACQTPLSMGFFRQEDWSGLSFPSPGNLPNPGIKPMSLVSLALAGELFTTSATWEAPCMCICPKEEERVFTELKHQWPQKHSLGFLYRGQHNTEGFPPPQTHILNFIIGNSGNVRGPITAMASINRVLLYSVKQQQDALFPSMHTRGYRA